MIRRPSLSSKILFLAFLNLCLLAAVVLVFAGLQFRFRADAMLLSPSRDRLVALAGSVARDLEETPVESRDELLARYKGRYGAGFYLFDRRGIQLGGPAVRLPNEVLPWVSDDRHPGPPRGSRRGGPVPPPGADSPGGPPTPPPADAVGSVGRPPLVPDGPPAGRSVQPMDDGPRGRSPLPPPPVIMAIARRPTRYWVGVRLPIRSAGDRRVTEGVLMVESDTIFNSRIFFDFRLLLAAFVAVIAISALCWLPFIRGLTLSITQMNRATEQIAEGQFDIHVSAKRSDELGRLGAQINRMAARLAGFVTGQRRFLGDISHELCAPLARVQFAIGILDQRADETQRQYVEILHGEVQHMSGLINELLLFSKAGLKPVEAELAPVNLAATVERVLAREASASDQVQVSIDPSLHVLAEESYLFRSLSNLVRNAIRYAGNTGPISVSARRDNDHVVITVADSGPGLPEEAVEEVFKPFYRPEASRSRDTGGVGLGLAIVKSCIESCRGSVSCRNRTPSGLEVIVRLSAA